MRGSCGAAASTQSQAAGSLFRHPRKHNVATPPAELYVHSEANNGSHWLLRLTWNMSMMPCTDPAATRASSTSRSVRSRPCSHSSLPPQLTTAPMSNLCRMAQYTSGRCAMHGGDPAPARQQAICKPWGAAHSGRRMRHRDLQHMSVGSQRVHKDVSGHHWLAPPQLCTHPRRRTSSAGNGGRQQWATILDVAGGERRPSRNLSKAGDFKMTANAACRPPELRRLLRGPGVLATQADSRRSGARSTGCRQSECNAVWLDRRAIVGTYMLPLLGQGLEGLVVELSRRQWWRPHLRHAAPSAINLCPIISALPRAHDNAGR